jgi:hypothetical protein
MKTIFKYPITITRFQSVEMPDGAKPIHVGLSPDGTPCIWAEVNTENPIINHSVNVVGTGHDITNLTFKRHVGTFLQGPFVWHVYFADN